MEPRLVSRGNTDADDALLAIILLQWSRGS